jgi:AcrR family transcriptional regulator
MIAALHDPNMPGTKEQIVDAARRLFSERSYLGVSMSDIATDVGTTKAALYHHFPSKEDIYATVLDRVKSDLILLLSRNANDEDPSRRLRALVKRYLEFGIRERNLLNALVGRLASDRADLRKRIMDARREIHELARPVVERILENAGRPGATDARALTTMMTAMLDGLITSSAFRDEPLDTDEMSWQVVTALGLTGRGTGSQAGCA